MTKSNKDLALEMIVNCRKFTTPRIQNKAGAKRYEDTMYFVLGLLGFPESGDFKTLQDQMAYISWSAVQIQPSNKYERKYFDLAIEHCEDIVNSVDLRFVSGYEK